eukprot:COSAG05_NODE_853_length_6963_cov_5.582314_1_plen_113_part_00
MSVGVDEESTKSRCGFECTVTSPTSLLHRTRSIASIRRRAGRAIGATRLPNGGTAAAQKYGGTGRPSERLFIQSDRPTVDDPTDRPTDRPTDQPTVRSEPILHVFWHGMQTL